MLLQGFFICQYTTGFVICWMNWQFAVHFVPIFISNNISRPPSFLFSISWKSNSLGWAWIFESGVFLAKSKSLYFNPFNDLFLFVFLRKSGIIRPIISHWLLSFSRTLGWHFSNFFRFCVFLLASRVDWERIASSRSYWISRSSATC